MKVYFVRRKKYVVKLWFVVGSCPFCFTSKISDPSSGKRGLKSVFSDFLLFYSGQLSPHLATVQKDKENGLRSYFLLTRSPLSVNLQYPPHTRFSFLRTSVLLPLGSHYIRVPFLQGILQDLHLCPGQCTIDSLFSCLFASASSNITSDPALPHRPLQLCFDPYHAHRFSLKIPRLLSMIPASLQPLSSASRSLALSITVVSSGSQVPLRLRSFRINSL